MVEILRKIYLFFVDIIQTLLLAAAVFLVIYVFLFRPFQVNGNSMYPNFHHKEYVLTNIITLHFNDPKRGDVVVFKSPSEPDKDFIKRVIGTPGDKMMLRDGLVYINGSVLDESGYLNNDVKTYGAAFLKENSEITIGQGEFFVLGDNRANSSDSREWGPVSKSLVIGKSFFVYWPPQSMGFIDNPYN